MSGKKVYAGGLRIGTRCETIDDFIEIFHRFCDGSIIFIPHAKRQVGIDAAFSFDLKDGRTALSGVGVVLEQFTDANNRFGRPGVVIELRQLAESSRPVFEQMSAMQRSRRGTAREVRPTMPPTNAATPVSPRKLTPIPSYRPRAVTAAIEIDSAIAFAKESAAAKSGGLAKRTLPSMPIAVPKLIPFVAPSAPIQAASAMHGDTASDEPTQPPPLPAAPELAQASGAMVDEAPETAALAEASDPRQEAMAPLQEDRPWVLAEDVKPDAPTHVASVAIPVGPHPDALAAIPVGPHPDAPAAIPVGPHPDAPIEAKAAAIVEPPSFGHRLGVAVRRLAGETQTKSRRVASALTQRWRVLTQRGRWLVGSAAAAPVVALVIVLVVASKSPAPQPAPPSQGSNTGSAAAVVAPTVEPAPKPTVKKKKKKKKRVAIKKRVASKPAAVKKPVAKKPVATKPVATKPAAKPTAVKKPAAKPTVVKKSAPEPTPKPPATQ